MLSVEKQIAVLANDVITISCRDVMTIFNKSIYIYISQATNPVAWNGSKSSLNRHHKIKFLFGVKNDWRPTFSKI